MDRPTDWRSFGRTVVSKNRSRELGVCGNDVENAVAQRMASKPLLALFGEGSVGTEKSLARWTIRLDRLERPQTRSSPKCPSR